MRELIVFSDLHLDRYSQFAHKSDRLQDCINALADVLEYSKPQGYCFFAGDFFNTKMLYPGAVNEVVSYLANFFAGAPDFILYMLPGNHDMSTKNIFGREKETVRSIDFLARSFPQNIIISEKQEGFRFGDVTVSLIPYYDTAEDFSKALDELLVVIQNAQHCRHFLLIHQTPDSTGNTMIEPHTLISDPRYQEFEHVFCGHIHCYKQLSDNFTLIGNLLQRDMGDRGQEKGFIAYDLATKEQRFISRRGKYPEFIYAKPGDAVPENAFVYFEAPISEAATEQERDFSSTLAPETLLVNFTAVHGQGDNIPLQEYGKSLLQ
jgi:DNA repair exonuclease SbcCD nuclease subunit